MKSWILSGFFYIIKTMLKNILKKIIPDFLINFYHCCLAFLGALIYRFPSKKMTIIGVTGTSGKSTVVELTNYLLQKNGLKSCAMSSVTFQNLKMTMPGRFKIQKFFKEAIKQGCKIAVLEVTSEGIKQYRHKFIDFKIAVFTNLSKEHIESHKGFENYKKAKLKLFKSCKKIHIINLDDKNANYFWQAPAKQKIGYSSKEFEKFLPELNILGEFNKYNALSAVKTAMILGVSLENCKKALQSFRGLEGRMQIISKGPLVIIDYAHTPTQLEQVYKAIKGRGPCLSGRQATSALICVLGSCGGGRDKWKRPVMGKIAEKYCSKVIVTNEDPYNENPMKIISEVAGETSAQKILDRKEAIKKAIRLAKEEDAVIITGKGSEPLMCVEGGKKIPWSDKKIAEEALAKRKNTL